MECEEARAALSARLDGEPEPAGTDPDAVDAHLAACPDCPVWFAAAADLNRRLRVSAAPTEEPQPRDAGELARQMSALAENTPELSQRLRSRSLPLTLCRVVLVVLAVLYIAWAVVLLVNSTDVPDSPSVAGAGGEVANSGDPDLARLSVDAATVRRLWLTRTGMLFGVFYLVLAVWMFLFFLPVYSGLPLTHQQWHWRMWLPGWT